MRFGFGLISLLVVLAIAMMIFKSFEAPALEQGKKAQDQAQQMSGRDQNGVAAMSSYTSEEYSRAGNSTFSGIKIDSVMPGGPMDTYYGLKPGDVVLQVNSLDVTAVGDYGSAKAQLDEAFQKNAPLLVDRGGVKMTLPIPGTPGADKTNNPLGNLNIPTH